MDYGSHVVRSGTATFNSLSSWLSYPKSTDAYSSGAIAGAFSFSMFLFLMRTRFVWWPFHPVGYVIGINGTSVDNYWFAMIIASTVKFIALKHGGARTYRKLLPFFLGLVLGDITLACLWSILSLIAQKPLYVVWFQN